MKDKVYIVWYRDTDIYRSDGFWGVYKDKFVAIEVAKEAARDNNSSGPRDFDSLEPGTKSYNRVKDLYIDGCSKLIAAFWPDNCLFTVEETPVQ